VGRAIADCHCGTSTLRKPIRRFIQSATFSITLAATAKPIENDEATATDWINQQLEVSKINLTSSRDRSMKALKVMATIDEQGQLTLDRPLVTDKNSRVEVIVLIPDPTESEEELTKESLLQDFRQSWHEAMTGQTIPIAQL
jgi:hypothetical protein